MKPIVLSVLGGSSPSTPVLIAAIRRSQQAGRLGEVELRLHGRNLTRLQRICEFGHHSLRQGAADETGRAPQLSLVASASLPEALRGATHILCMVRPGGMRGRAEDEALARSAGAVADEGLGLGGLRCHLRGRALIESLAQACARHAPGALLLQMSSPLGLNVALSRRALGDSALGICELPRTTARHLAALIEESAGIRWASHCHAGLNHQSWLYAFRDHQGRDITPQVLTALPDGAGLGVDTGKIRELGAVPVHYLRLFFHARQVRAEQRAAEPRGRVLERWSERVERALCAPGGPEPDVARLLAERRMDWFDEGVVPLLEALQQSRDSSFPLNVPAVGAMPDAPADAIVEVDCRVSSQGVRPTAVPPLPAAPAALVRALVSYERAALGLPTTPSVRALADVLAEHPLVPRRQIKRLALALSEVRPEPRCLPEADPERSRTRDLLVVDHAAAREEHARVV